MKELRILIIEDSAQDAALLLREIRKAGYTPVYERVATAETMARALGDRRWNVILADYNMPGFDAFGALDVLKAAACDIPFLVVSGFVGEETAVELMRKGACDFIKKGEYTRLVPAIEREVREAESRAEKRAAEAALKKSENLLSQATTVAGIGTFESDLVGGIPRWNEQYLKIYGFCPGEFDGKRASIMKRIHSGDRERVEAAFREALETNKDYLLEYRVLLPDGECRCVSVSGRVVKDPGTGSRHVYGAVFDVTERKEFEEALQSTIHARDEFISIASHELKTPLTPMKIQAGLVKRFLDTEKPVSKELIEGLVSAVNEGVDKLARLVDDMLDVSRMYTGRLSMEMTDFDIVGITRKTVARFAQEHAKGPEIRLISEESVMCHGDAGRIEQVLANLISNALKYGRGTPIVVRLTKRGDDSLMLSVSDQGVGISPEDQQRIFERFERGRASPGIGGLGLGLYIAKQIVKAHRGVLQVASAVGQGTTFTMLLPLQHAWQKGLDYEKAA